MLDEKIKILTKSLSVATHAKEVAKLETAKQSEIIIGRIIHEEKVKVDTEKSQMTKRTLDGRERKRQRSEERDGSIVTGAASDGSVLTGASSIVSGIISSAAAAFGGGGSTH